MKLRKLYSDQMGPLCAASLEQGSYQRGYDYIVRWDKHMICRNIFIHVYDFGRLHMLQELEDGVRHLLAPLHGGKCDVLLHTWQARSQLIQVCEVSLPDSVYSCKSS